MAEIVNRRRARKGKARATGTAQGNVTRTKHAVSKGERDIARARTEKLRQIVEAHRLKELDA